MSPDERYRRLLLGQVHGVAEHILALAKEPAPLSRAWCLTLEAALAEAEGRGGSRDTRAAEIGESPASPDVERVLRLGYQHRARRAWLDFDDGAGAAWLAAAQELEPAEGSPAHALEVQFAGLEGGGAPAFDRELLRAAATEAGDAATVIGLGVLQAWTAELEADHVGALAAARRASRMARTEAMPQQEYLANVMLARCRRLVGHPHLAARILRSLAGIASAQWRPWLAWELLMAGAAEEARALLGEAAQPAHAAARATGVVLELLAAGEQGDLAGFDSAARTLRQATARSRRLGLDADALLGALDARAPLGPERGWLHRWAVGDEPGPPRGLHGLAAAIAGPAQMKGALVFVAAGSGGRRRVLTPGTRLLTGHYHPMTQSQRRQGRMDTMVAALALAGPAGLETEELFRRVYGFVYDDEIHRGALRKLLVRVDEWLGERAEVHQERSRSHLELRSPILVADPRCAPPVDVRVLGMLAMQGSTSAREAARRLEIPLRTAQAALQSLLADGACLRVREGNVVAYHIEDTTFSEPTQR